MSNEIKGIFVGIVNTVVCLIIAFLSIYFERYVEESFILIAYTILAIVLNLIWALKLGSDKRRIPFLSLLMMVVLTAFLLYSGVLGLLSDFTYDSGYSISSWGFFGGNWNLVYISIYSFFCFCSLLFGCIVNFVNVTIQRWNE